MYILYCHQNIRSSSYPLALIIKLDHMTLFCLIAIDSHLVPLSYYCQHHDLLLIVDSLN